jgi:hypothetical protein
MHRIDDPTNIAVMPAPRPQGTPGYFTGGSPGSGGFLATRVRYEFMNALQEELSAIAEAAGLTLDKTNNNQVLQALRSMLRFKLGQDEYFYINPAGDDANDGLTTMTPLRTGQAAWNKALTVDLNNHNLFLQFAAGTYTEPIVCSGPPLGIGPGTGVVLQGDPNQPQNVIFAPAGTDSCVSAGDGAFVTVSGVTLRASGIPTSYQNMGVGLIAFTGGAISFGDVDFDQCDYSHTVAIGGGVVQSLGNPYRIIGGGQYHLVAVVGGYVANVNSPVSLTGTPNFTGAFAISQTGSTIAAYSVAYAGAATGQRYAVSTNSCIVTNNAGPDYLPGSVAGIADASTFGLYL